MVKQRTLKNSVEVVGVGLHSGEQVALCLRPAPVDTGIVFRRVDLNPVVSIPAVADNVCDTRLCTSLRHDNVKIATIEHLMSAFAGLGIDNAFVDVNAPELPIMDGSSAPFVFLLQSVGIELQSKAKRYIKVIEPICIEEGDKYVRLEPFDGFKIKFDINFQHPVFNNHPQSFEINFSETSYTEAICRARTFGFLSDYEKLREANLAKGGSLDNAVVVDEYRILNQEGLRFKDEFVKHKILDAVGDLYLLGCGLIGAFEGYKSGHELNNKLLLTLIANPHKWEHVTFSDPKKAKVPFLPFSVAGLSAA